MARLGKVAADVAVKTGKGVTEAYRFLKLLVIAVVAVCVFGTAIIVYVGINNAWDVLRSPFSFLTPTKPEQKKPPEEADPELQLECFTAIVAKDIEGEIGRHIGTVRNEIADTVLRLRIKYPLITTCDIMRKALTFFPIDWDHKAHAKLWQDRSVAVIRKGQTSSAWTTAQLVAKAKYGTWPPADRCATNYVRAAYNLLTTPFSGESKGAAELLATMDPDPKLKDLGFKTQLLCPR